MYLEEGDAVRVRATGEVGRVIEVTRTYWTCADGCCSDCELISADVKLESHDRVITFFAADLDEVEEA